ncbi:MAG: site-2 protease family protein [Candidatus Bathyarchaeaceae archaeon]
MCSAPLNDYSAEPSDWGTKFEEIRILVESEFDVEEGFIDHGVPTFYVKLRENSKEAFLKLTRRMNPIGFIPILRRKDEKVVLRTIPTPPKRPSRKVTNVALFLATIGTVLFAGFLQSPDIPEALMFTGAIMAILGSHEMGHKLLADKREVEATYPYFIPGPPPIGTFGAVIQQKSLPPNKDALFDLGAAGPIFGFMVAVIVALIGLPLSHLEFAPPNTQTLPTPILFHLILSILPPRGVVGLNGDGMLVVALHPLAFAGWVGMFVTLVNLVPAGMLDGGHVTRSFLGERARTILAYLVIAMLFMMGPLYYFMAIIALFFSTYRHPGPLDDVSKLTTSRKLAALTLILIFILCVDWYRFIRTLTGLLTWV